MRRLLLCLLLCLLLSACRTPQAVPALTGTWVNAGQYSADRDFVETLTLNEDGTAKVHLDYQGKPYADLTGTWTAEGGTLSVDFTDPDTRDRVYTYALTETTLKLSGGGKDAEYVRR